MTANQAGPWVKVRFTNGQEHTAGLVLPYARVGHATISDLSRLFPMSEAGKMHRIDVSPQYAVWEDAFKHQFDRGDGQ